MILPHRLDDMNHFQRLCVIALCSTGLGIGLFRFSYTALMPLTIDQHWWDLKFASELASANLIGYLIGAVIAFTAIKELQIGRVILYSALLGSISLLCCGMQGFADAWYLFWRVLSGVTGGFLMVLGPSFALKQVLPEQKHLLGLIAFSGIGLGVLLTTTLLPQLGHLSVAIAWYALGTLGLILTLILALMLNQIKQRPSTAQQTPSTQTLQFALTRRQYWIAGLVIAAYFMSAVAYIPHSLFWVDFMVHHLYRPQNFANLQWMIYGVGSLVGALIAYISVRRWGGVGALWRLYLIYAIAIFLPAYFDQPLLLTLSSFFTGAMNPATVSLSSTLLADIVSSARHRQAWGIAVMVFAIAQLIGGLGMGYLLVNSIEYQQLFAIGATVMGVGVGLSLIVARTRYNVHQQKEI